MIEWDESTEDGRRLKAMVLHVAQRCADIAQKEGQRWQREQGEVAANIIHDTILREFSVTPPGVESGSGQTQSLTACPECGTINGHFGNCSRSDLYEPPDGSGHQCAARKALKGAERNLNFLHQHVLLTTPVNNDSSDISDRVRNYIDGSLKLIRAALTQPCLSPRMSDDYVAWLRWSGDQEHRHLVVCNSDAEGAFKVYR